MTGLEIFAYYKKQTKEIEKNFFPALVLHEELPIHDLRVAVKRLRALFKFLKEERILRPEAACYLKQLEKIYTALGHLRDIQIRIGLLKSFNLDGHKFFFEYNKDLRKHLNRYREKLSVVHRSFSYASFLKFKCHKPFYPVRGIRLDEKQIIASRILKIRRHLRHKNVEGHLHPIRKRLKEIYYCMEMSGLDKAEIQSVNLNLKKIRKLEDTIGQWHDTYLLMHTLHYDHPAFVHITEKESFENIRKMVCEENQNRLEHILNHLAKFQVAEEMDKQPV